MASLKRAGFTSFVSKLSPSASISPSSSSAYPTSCPSSPQHISTDVFTVPSLTPSQSGLSCCQTSHMLRPSEILLIPDPVHPRYSQRLTKMDKCSQSSAFYQARNRHASLVRLHNVATVSHKVYLLEGRSKDRVGLKKKKTGLTASMIQNVSHEVCKSALSSFDRQKHIVSVMTSFKKYLDCWHRGV